MIRDLIMRFKVLGAEGYEIGFKHRESGVGERIVYISISRVRSLGKWAMELDDGSSIPYHRVVEIRDDRGVTIWRR